MGAKPPVPSPRRRVFRTGEPPGGVVAVPSPLGAGVTRISSDGFLTGRTNYSTGFGTEPNRTGSTSTTALTLLFAGFESVTRVLAPSHPRMLN